MPSLGITSRIGVAGALVGFLGAVGIYFEPAEPYKHWIVLAGTLNGVLTALLITVFIHGRSSVGAGLVAGALCGLAMAIVVFLAKGGWSSGDAPYVVPTGLVEGLVLGLFVRWSLRPE